MHHVMFDVDGTLVMSDRFDGVCYLEAVCAVLGHSLDTNWEKYTFVSDTGILDQHIRENGLVAKRDEIHIQVKKAFVRKIIDHVIKTPVQQVAGASSFLDELRQQENLSVSIATGGWLETALIKLESAGIDIAGIPIASSNDHYSRVEIMKIAKKKAGVSIGTRCTYFGDGAWDKQACAQLGFNFVLVGDKIAHDQRIHDFNDKELALGFIVN